ncbi:hypothetical protein AB91_2389 [Escherichia coli 2-460-02_S3_C1]|nr:hypothetical protein AB91_2389 [Escherichia coli 2-460-02_S3_C1]KDY64693.1 hypothetical protein AC20_0718 [Escherichia coli 2-460-02_S3_C2]
MVRYLGARFVSDVGRMPIVKRAVLLMLPMLYAMRTQGFPFSQVYNP